MTEAERHLTYAKAMVDHPDPQLQPLLVQVYGPSLSRLQAQIEQESVKAVKNQQPS
jgi:hypothetical protein